jgi:hypothetical protein
MKKTQRSRIAFWLVTCSAMLVLIPVSRAQWTFIVDDFAPGGVGLGNPTNYDYYTYTNNYAAGQITNVWWNWFGSAFTNLVWDGTTDAGNNPNSGSMEITANFTSNTNTSTYSQWVIWQQGWNVGNNYLDWYNMSLDGSLFTNLSFQCDVKFAAGSASDSGTYGSPIFGHLRFGIPSSSWGAQDWFAQGVDIANTNTNWVHVNIPLSALTDPNLANILGVLIQIDSSYYSLNLNGPSTLWIDNIEFVGTPIVNPPPTLGMQKATPALRIFAGSTGTVNDREQIATLDQRQAWVGSAGYAVTYPVSYSFTLLSFPAVQAGSVFTYHMFLVPTNASDSHAGQFNFHNNQYVEYQCKDDLWLVIQGGTNQGLITAQIAWKTNLANSNPTNQALLITNSTAVGTWTLTFTNATGGTLTAPGASPAPFSIPAAAAAQFTNPLVAFFGVQPNSPWGEGQYVDVSHIQTIGVTGPVNDNFTTDTAINPAVWDTSDSAQPSSLVLVTNGSAYWVNWTMPDTDFLDPGTGLGELGVATNLTSGQWVVPEYYNYYNDGVFLPNSAAQGTMKWTLIPTNCLPTVDGQPQNGQRLSPNAFFRLFNNTNPPAQP